MFIDAKGNSYYDSGKTGNHSDRAYYKKISSGEVKYCIENPTIAKATGKVSVMVVKGAYAKNGALVGMFVGVHALDYVLNFRRFNFIIVFINHNYTRPKTAARIHI